MNWIRKFFGSPEAPPVPEAFLNNPDLSADQLDRKHRSETLLAQRRIHINPHLPCIEAIDEIEFRSSREIFERFVALSFTALRAAEMSNAAPDRVVDDFIHERVDLLGAAEWFTPEEKAFFAAAEPDANTCLQLSWRYEAAFVLLWALDEQERALPYPDDMVDIGTIITAVRDDYASLSNAPRRPDAQILDEADLIYRFHWAVRDASITGNDPGGNLHPGVVMERHHALNWLIGYEDQDWDEVSTDT